MGFPSLYYVMRSGQSQNTRFFFNIAYFFAIQNSSCFIRCASDWNSITCPDTLFHKIIKCWFRLMVKNKVPTYWLERGHIIGMLIYPCRNWCEHVIFFNTDGFLKGKQYPHGSHSKQLPFIADSVVQPEVSSPPKLILIVSFVGGSNALHSFLDVYWKVFSGKLNWLMGEFMPWS